MSDGDAAAATRSGSGEIDPQGARTALVDGGRRNDGRAGATFQGPGRSDYYYGHPIVATPVWEPHIAWYLFTGGLAGASSALAFAARLAGNDTLARNAGFASLAGLAPSPVLLIWDLGRPARFLYMLRVFKPTSPMSMGTWLISVDGAAITAAVASELTGYARPVGRAAEAVAGVLGLGLATYTGVLFSDTATPVWNEARRELPFVFAAGAAMTAGAAAAAATPVADAGPARRLAVLAAVAELVALQLMERRLGPVGEVYEQGRAGMYAKAAKALTVAGAGVLAVAGRRRRGAVAGAALLLTGALAERFAVFNAGFPSAENPKYLAELQRGRLERGEGYRSAAGAHA